jgi:hypothetical protein
LIPGTAASTIKTSGVSLRSSAGTKPWFARVLPGVGYNYPKKRDHKKRNTL